ncbi:MAG: hypothetical protein HC914_03900 [Chloroflexaceae bacterium]|nr:hypothetical protein [Chloroflexaceae bacterium]
MAYSVEHRSFTEIRRRDRAVTDEAWIQALLHRAPFAALATVVDGQPFINSNLFVYDEAAACIYMHTPAPDAPRTMLPPLSGCV